MVAVAPFVDPPVLQDRFYYLTNFHAMLDWLGQRYADLLPAADRRFIAAFRALPHASQALLTRMVMRRSDLFRAGKLNYAEIGDTASAMAPLLAAGLAEQDPELELDEVFALLTRAELAELFGLPRDIARLPKAQWFEHLAPTHTGTRRASEWGIAEPVYRLSCADLCEQLRITYFGNFHQDWSEFVLADLRIFRFERIECSRGSRAFQSTAQIEAFRRLYECRRALHEEQPLDEVLARVPEAITDSAWIEARRQRLLFRIAQAFEAQRRPEQALEVYVRCTHPGSCLRRALIEERAGRAAAARTACEQGLALRSEAGVHHRLQRVLRRLARREGNSLPPRRAPRIAFDTLTLLAPAPALRVELAALEYLQAQEPGSSVHWVENALVNSLFGLLCWEAIFAPLPGAFFHPYHHGPADLLAADFRERRAEAFEQCFAQLRSGAHAQQIRRRFEAKQGIQSPFVHWDALDGDTLEQALRCIPAAHLELFFRWMLKDLGNHGAGFPDLVQFWPAQRSYRMIEIKGPGDRLQENQRRLFEHCAPHGLPMQVLNVRWT